jgi:hypothetical protein
VWRAPIHISKFSSEPLPKQQAGDAKGSPTNDLLFILEKVMFALLVLLSYFIVRPHAFKLAFNLMMFIFCL